MRKYFYEIKRQDRNLNMRQYIYWIGPYRYNWHEELEIMLKELEPEGLMYTIDARSQEEAENLLKMAEKWRKK